MGIRIPDRDTKIKGQLIQSCRTSEWNDCDSNPDQSDSKACVHHLCAVVYCIAIWKQVERLVVKITYTIVAFTFFYNMYGQLWFGIYDLEIPSSPVRMYEKLIRSFTPGLRLRHSDIGHNGSRETDGCRATRLNLLPHYLKCMLHGRRQFTALHFSNISLCLACTLYKDFLCTDHFITNTSTCHSWERSYNYAKRSK